MKKDIKENTILSRRRDHSAVDFYVNQKMKIVIIDHQAIAPDERIILDVIESHPISKDLYTYVRIVVIKKADKESIEYDFHNKKVTLNLTDIFFGKVNYKYILFHEFSHVADKIRPEFNYSEKLKNLLSDLEKLLVMELWNVYIDSRLNYYKMFMIGSNDAGIYGKIDGKLQKFPATIEGKLLVHISFLQSRKFQDPKTIVENIWNNPQQIMSYDGLIEIVKERFANHENK